MTSGASARLFVAVDLPGGVRRELTRWARGAASSARASGGRLRLLEPETLHVTLCFLGSQPVGAIDAIAQAVQGAWSEPVGELSLGAPLWLPKRRPRALAVELHDDARSALRALRDAVARELEAVCSFEAPTRSFLPHVTVARMRSEDVPRDRALPATPQLAFEPETVTLYRSWLGPTEASYEALASCAMTHPAVE
jgi:RNA 2',3'-cyclic 3'-phosphodiesterase